MSDSPVSENVEMLIGIANQALGDARDIANRIVRTTFNAGKAKKIKVDEVDISRPGEIGGLSKASFSHAVSLADAQKPKDTSGLIRASQFNHTVTKPSMAKPGALTGIEDNDTSAATLKWLDGEAEKWYAKFFPELDACLKTAPEQWLCGIITGHEPFGLPKEVFDAIWHQARDREYRARNSAVEQIRTEFSMRGFSMPPGAMLAATNRAEEAASDAIAGINVAQAIRDSEIKLELLKFAEEQAIALKLGVMQSLADFYRQWIELPKQGFELARVNVQAYESLNRALSDYYRVELGFEELRMKAAELRANGSIAVSKLNLEAYTSFQQALSEFNRGQIGIEELRVRAAEMKAKIDLDGNQSKVAAYAAFQRALSDYNSGKLTMSELKMKAEEAESRADAQLKQAQFSASAQSHAASANATGNAVRAFGDVAAQAAGAAGSLVAHIVSE